MSNPKVTVLMPVYNAEKYVGEAIESILNQTFRDFEFLIINDGSTDNSLGIIESYKDLRIKLVNNEKNLGLSHTLNKGIDLSEGEYIARMDADDISLPVRLEKQINFMDSHLEIGICGTWIEGFGDPELCGVWKAKKEHNELFCNLMFGSSFAHPSVMMRKTILMEYNALRYEHDYCPCEDYRLWYLLLSKTQGTNLQECLLLYRRERNSGQMSETLPIVANTDRVRLDVITDLIGDLTDDDKSFYLYLLNQKISDDVSICNRSVQLIVSIIRANQKRKIFPEPTFRRKLARFLFAKLYSSINIKAYAYLFSSSTFFKSIEKFYLIGKPFHYFYSSMK